MLGHPMSNIFLCFDISNVEVAVVNEQCRNQNATSKMIYSILQFCLVLNLSFAATVSGRPMCFSLLSTAEKIKGKKCVEITRSKAA